MIVGIGPVRGPAQAELGDGARVPSTGCSPVLPGAPITTGGGTTTCATVPFASGRCRRLTMKPPRRASRATTKRPIRDAACRSIVSLRASRVFSRSISSDGMPTPESTTSRCSPPSEVKAAESTIELLGGEYIAALSSSSASRWISSPATVPATAAPPTGCSRTRSYCSISLVAARNSSATRTGAVVRLRIVEPASTSRLSLYRRIRAARWSSRNRLRSWSGSSSVLSSSSMIASCFSTIDWLRRDMLTNASSRVRRSRTWEAANRTASAPRLSTARATSIVSGPAEVPGGSTAGRPTTASGPFRSISATAFGRLTWAASPAPTRSSRSGTLIDLASRATSRPTTSRVSRLRAVTPIARNRLVRSVAAALSRSDCETWPVSARIWSRRRCETCS